MKIVHRTLSIFFSPFLLYCAEKKIEISNSFDEHTKSSLCILADIPEEDSRLRRSPETIAKKIKAIRQRNRNKEEFNRLSHCSSCAPPYALQKEKKEKHLPLAQTEPATPPKKYLFKDNWMVL